MHAVTRPVIQLHGTDITAKPCDGAILLNSGSYHLQAFVFHFRRDH